MLRTKLIPAVLLLVVLSVFAVAVLATGGTPGGDGDDQVKEDVVQAILDDDGNVIDHNRRLAQVSSDHEGGFGGWYFSDDKNTVYVFMKDTSKTTEARSAVEAAYVGKYTPANVVVVSGAHSLTELSTWLYQLVDGLVTEGINFKSVAIDHSQNRIDLGVAEDSHIDIAKRVMKDLQIPENAIDITVDDSQLLGGGDLKEEWRPVAGAIQHQQIFDGVKCTIGFVTERNDEEGFILASHCTNETKSIGGNDHATIHQPNNPFFGSNVIGEESIDPSLYGIDDDLCVYNHVCRYSDAAYAELDGDEDLDLGGIAEPVGYNSTDVNPAYNTLSITKEEPYFSIGDEVEFIGRTSGWEKAEIVHTCAAAQVKGPLLGNPGNIILCAGKAEPLPGYNGPNEGDSGAPVFVRNGNNVELLGTLFYGGSQGFYFSKIGNIYRELGSSVSWDTCTSGC